MSGWLTGFILIIIIGIANILAKTTAHLELSSAVYVSQGMMAGAFVLLLLSKPGRLSLPTILHPNTWIYGIVFFLFNATAIYVLRFIDVAALMQLQRFSTVLTFILVWVFMGRRLNWRKNFICQIIILAGVGFMLVEVSPTVLGVVLVGTLFMCVLLAAEALVLETHTPNNQAKTFEEEIRVTAFVMAVTGLLSYSIMLVLSTLTTFFNVEMVSGMVPDLRQFFHPYSLLFASVYGVFAFSSMRFFEFQTIKKLKSERYMLLLAFLPFSGLFFEYVADWVGVVPMHIKNLSTNQIISLFLITFGSLISIYFTREGQKSTPKISA